MSIVSPTAMESRCYPQDLEAGPWSAEDAKCCSDESTTVDDNSLIDVASAEGADVLDGGAVFFDSPPVLAFRDVGISVPCGSSRKQILHGVCGEAVGGRMLAIMGGSGAGKTSLLDVLTLRAQKFGSVSGTVTLNSEPWTQNRFLKYGVLVRQEPLLWAQLTTRETLTYCISLYRPDLSGTSRGAIVSDVLEKTGLVSCADTRVGDPSHKGLSGGQKKRLCIAEALMKRPAVMILDGPTSDLDSTAAYEVARLLHDLSVKCNLVVACTIHQPGHRTFSLFHDLLVLSKGCVAYCGPSGAVQEYMFRLDVPRMAPAMSLPEYLLDLTNPDFTAAEQIQKLLEAWARRAGASDLVLSTSGSLPCNASGGFHQQTALLIRRLACMLLRDPTLYTGRWIFALISSIVFAVVYNRAADRVQREVIPRMFLLVWCMGAPAFMSVVNISAYTVDFHIFGKELANGMYSKSAYVAAQTLVMLPACFTLSLCSLIPAFLIVGYSWAAFPTMWVAHAACMLWAECLSQLLAVCSPHVLLGMVGYIAIQFVAYIQAGVVVSIGDIPWVLRWFSFINPWLLALRAMVVSDFERESFGGFGIAGELCQAPPAACYGRDGKNVLNAVGIGLSSFGGEHDPWQDISIAAAFALLLKVAQISYIKFAH